jgi:hypothetical protein
MFQVRSTPGLSPSEPSSLCVAADRHPIAIPSCSWHGRRQQITHYQRQQTSHDFRPYFRVLIHAEIRHLQQAV